jgi:regulator of sigma E protease
MMSLVAGLLLWAVPFLLVIGIVITVHEFGHFLAGKAVDAKIDQFSIGFFGPLASWRDKSGVEWRLGWLPIGGFVRFAGDDNAASVPVQEDLEVMREDILAREGPAALRRYHYFKPLWARALISVAGPAANFILSVTIFAALLLTLGESIAVARIEAVVPGTPAARAGLLPGDVVLKADGETVKTFDTVKQAIVLRTGIPIKLVVDRGGREVPITVTPERGDVPDTVGHVHRMGTIGVRFAHTPIQTQHYGPLGALKGGVEKTVGVVKTTVFYLGRMIGGHENADQISGPLGMAQISHDLAKETVEGSADVGSMLVNQFLTVLILAANISVGIGFLNLMPIPVLDGGHLLFYAYEAVARRPLAAKVQAAGYRVGLALVLGLMLFATWNDLQRLHVFNFLGGLHS